MEQVRDALFHANHPFLMVMVGPFGSGKSSIINALLGEEVMEVGPIPTTDQIVILRRGADMQRIALLVTSRPCFTPARCWKT